MRALVFDAPAPDTGTSRVAELPVPEPGADQVSIDVACAGVNFKDVMARRGDPGYVTAWPFVPGLEVVGRVRALGPSVTSRQVGDRVVAFTGAGGLAEVAVADVALTAPLPHGLDVLRATAAPGALVTAALLIGDIGRLQPGETLLVHSAAGGVGQAVAALARPAGAGLLLGTVGSPARVAAAKQAGYDEVFVRGPGLDAGIEKATDGQGIDLVLDPHGSAFIDTDLKVAAPAARIVLFGNTSGEPLGALPPLTKLMAANVSVTGFSLAALAAAAPHRVAVALAGVLDRLAAGEVDVQITEVGGLEAAPQAQQALADGRGEGKYVVRLATINGDRRAALGDVS